MEKQLYIKRFSESAEYRKKVWQVLIDNWFSKWIPDDVTILDLGCGWGEFINQIKAKKKYAIDLNADAKNHLNNDVHFINQKCSDQWDVSDESLDIVFSSNFFEHLPDKATLSRTIQEAKRCLKSDGKIICMGPNIKYVDGAYWDFWDHHLPLTELSLKELFVLNDLYVIICINRFLPYTMSNGREFPLFFLHLYLMLPAIWPFFGKQYLVICKKQ